MSGAPPGSMRAHRSPLLDCIRAVAIIMVVFYHVATRHEALGVEIDAVQAFFRRWGLRGVDVFFPLSGFLITSFLLRSERPDFIKAFFMRRVFRIVPLYFVAVTLALAGMYVTGTETYLIDRSWINYTFLTAWFIQFQGPGTVPYTISWSLSVEEFAYILTGLMAWASRRHLAPFLLGITLLAIAIKFNLAADGRGFYFLPPARLDSVALGGLTAWLMLHAKRPLLWLVLATAATYLVEMTGRTASVALFYTQIALIVCILIVIFETWARAWRDPVTDAVAAIGFYSYFTYLFHIFVIDVLYRGLPHVTDRVPPFLAMGAVALLVTHVAAMISYRVFEGPVMRFGRRLETRGPTPDAPSVPGRDRG